MHQNAESDSQGPSPSAESPTQAKREDFSLQMQLTYGTSHTVPTEMGPYPREESLHRITTPDKRLGLDDTNVAQGAQQPRDEQLRLRGVGCGPPAPGAGAECALLSGSATGSWGGGLREGQHLALSLGTHLEMAPPDFTKQLGAASLRGQRTRLSKWGPPGEGPRSADKSTERGERVPGWVVGAEWLPHMAPPPLECPDPSHDTQEQS